VAFDFDAEEVERGAGVAIHELVYERATQFGHYFGQLFAGSSILHAEVGCEGNVDYDLHSRSC